MRAASAVLLFFAAVLWGTTKSHALGMRWRAIRSIMSDIEKLCAKIELSGLPIHSAVSRCELQCAAFWDGFRWNLENGRSCDAAWRICSVSPCLSALTADDMSVLTDFFSLLGKGDMEHQIAGRTAAVRALSRQLDEAEAAAARGQRLFSTLGVLAGLAIAIMII